MNQHTALTHAAPVAVIKREGRTVAFDASKIASAIERAGTATSEFGPERAQVLTATVTERLARRVTGVEQIQDEVERVLLEGGHLATARAYIAYREQHHALRRDRQVALDVERSVNEYLAREDWRVNANANQGYSLGGLILNVSGKVVANYWLSHVYPPEVGLAHREADIHIHDLDMLSGYCAGWSLRTLLHEGLNGVPGKVEAAPPKHLSSAVGQIVNFLGTLQNEWAGAQAFSSFDTTSRPSCAGPLSYDPCAVPAGADPQPHVLSPARRRRHQPDLRLTCLRPARAGL
jgi:ribonucleoside-triphosphate reductase